MTEVKLEQSPNWEKHKNTQGFIEEGFPFHEGFPRNIRRSSGELSLFTLITRDGERHVAEVDTSTQYRAEGLNWTTYPERRVIYPHTVVAWNELDKS